MRTIQLGTSQLSASSISLGCMAMGKLTEEDAKNIISQALELGINHFDHADIYQNGQSEEIFSKAIASLSTEREKLMIQTKAGIRKGYYDFSSEHLLQSAEQSLKRLGTDYLDLFLLHRPDALMEPEEVAEAFSKLHQSGKVRYFGVSNHTPMQIELLKKYLDQDLIVNQLQLSVMHTGMIDSGIQMNNRHDHAIDRDGGILDYCRIHDITIQAWSPLRYGLFEGFFVDNPAYQTLNDKLEEIGERYSLTKTAVAIAWILRHPANIQVIAGTMTPKRLSAIAEASNVKLSRQEWYEIYLAAGNELP